MNVKTQCQHCSQHIEYVGEQGGVNINCPSCSNLVFIPMVTQPLPNVPTLPIQSKKQESIGWGVFKGIFGFFVLLPIFVIIGLILLGSVIGGCNNTIKQKDKTIHNITNNTSNQIISTISPPNYGDWQIEHTISPIDDSKGWILTLRSSESIQGTLGFPTHPTLYIRKKESKIQMYINWDIFLGMDEIDVTFRFGTNKSLELPCNISTDKKAIFIPQILVTNVVGALRNVDKFVVRLTPYNESPKTVIFDTIGLKETFNELKEWKKKNP